MPDVRGTLRAMTTRVGTCPVCGERFMRAAAGRPRLTCSTACGTELYRRRHPLGWRMLAELGIEDRGPLEMLRRSGVRDA